MIDIAVQQGGRQAYPESGSDYEILTTCTLVCCVEQVRLAKYSRTGTASYLGTFNALTVAPFKWLLSGEKLSDRGQLFKRGYCPRHRIQKRFIAFCFGQAIVPF